MTTSTIARLFATALLTLSTVACIGADETVTDGTAMLDADAIERIQQAMDELEDEVDSVTVDRDALAEAIEMLGADEGPSFGQAPIGCDPGGSYDLPAEGSAGMTITPGPIVCDPPIGLDITMQASAYDQTTNPEYRSHGPGGLPPAKPGYQAESPEQGALPVAPLSIVVPFEDTPAAGTMAECLDMCVRDYLGCMSVAVNLAEVCDAQLDRCRTRCAG